MNSSDLIPKELSDKLPLNFRFIDEIHPENTERAAVVKVIENKFYHTSQTSARSNYRLTSKLLINETK